MNMDRDETLGEYLDSLVGTGRLSPDEARRIRVASRWRLEAREVVMYLGGAIVGVGVIRLVVVVFEDASLYSIAAALYVAAAALVALALWTRHRSAMVRRLGEVAELGATLATSIATGLIAAEVGWSDETAVGLGAGVGLAWGALRCRATSFSGTVAIPPALFTFAANMVSILDLSEDTGGIVFIGVAVVLLALGDAPINAGLFPRVIGAITFMYSTIGWSGIHNDDPWVTSGIALAVAGFAYSVLRQWPDLLVTSAIAVVATVGTAVFSNVDDDVAQGVIMTAVGAVVLLATMVAYRRGVKRRSLGAPAV